MRVRAAVAADIPAITAIYAHWVAHGTASFEIDPPDEDEMRARYERVAAGGYPYLVLEAEASGVVGYAYASPYRTRPAYRFTVENSVYLHPAWVGRGGGRALLERLVEECRARGYAQIVAVIGDSANAASIGLHERLGFAPVGVLRNVGWKFGRWVDSVLLQKPLRPE